MRASIFPRKLGVPGISSSRGWGEDNAVRDSQDYPFESQRETLLSYRQVFLPHFNLTTLDLPRHPLQKQQKRFMEENNISQPNPCFISPLWLPRDFWLEHDAFFFYCFRHIYMLEIFLCCPYTPSAAVCSLCDAAVTKLWFTETSENPFLRGLTAHPVSSASILCFREPHEFHLLPVMVIFYNAEVFS